MTKKKKMPSIEKLEEILNSRDDVPVEIRPNGEVVVLEDNVDEPCKAAETPAPMMEYPGHEATDEEVARANAATAEALADHTPGAEEPTVPADVMAAVSVDEINVAIAQVCHETNRAYCAALGDDSQVAWDEAPQWQMDSAIAGVLAVAQNPLITSAQCHENWMALKESEGWTYGAEKDAGKKTHPCMVAYTDLPVEQQAKDAIFGAIARTMLGV